MRQPARASQLCALAVHQDYLKWCGGKFDPAKFTAAKATKAMKKGLPNWREMEEDAF